MIQIRSVFVWILVLFMPAAYGSSADKAHELLSKMCDAMKNESYKGTFVYMHDNMVESMEIIRRKDERGEVERLVSLNGEAREIIRDNTGVRCILPKSQKVTIDKSRAGSSFPGVLPSNLEKIKDYYQFSLDGAERVAGMEAHIVSLVPKDGYRYGHRMWIDKQSNLMVKSDLLNEQGLPVEQIMFTNLVRDADISDEELKPRYNAQHYQTIDSSQKPILVQTETQWKIETVPEGFSVVTHQRKMSGEVEMEHIVLSDGMASVSVFVEPLADEKDYLEGASRMGAISAFGALKSQHKITVVGEVPAATVMQIGENLQSTRF